MNHLVLSNPVLRQKLRSLSRARDQALAENSEKPVVSLEDASDVVVKCLRNQASRRAIVGIGGFPASGKTTAAKFIVRSINDFLQARLATHVPMDGFHLSNERLVVEGLGYIKGDISTYDLTSYVMKLREFKNTVGVPVLAPDYSREKHEVVDNCIEIGTDVRVLVTEGIYVGYSEGEWRKLRSLLDLVFYLDASPEQCADRIVARNLSCGRGESLIVKKLSNDFDFMKKSIQILHQAEYMARQELEIAP